MLHGSHTVGFKHTSGDDIREVIRLCHRRVFVWLQWVCVVLLPFCSNWFGVRWDRVEGRRLRELRVRRMIILDGMFELAGWVDGVCV